MEVIKLLENYLRGSLVNQALYIQDTAANLKPYDPDSRKCQEAMFTALGHSVNSLDSLASIYQKIRTGEPVEILAWPGQWHSFYLGNGGGDYPEDKSRVTHTIFDISKEAAFREILHYGARTLTVTTMQCLTNTNIAANVIMQHENQFSSQVGDLSEELGNQITELQIHMRTNSLSRLLIPQKAA